jgi:cell division protein FtsL
MQRKTAKRKRKGGILLLLLFFSFLLILSMGKRGFIQQYRVRQERKRLEQELESLKAEKKKLEEEIDRLDDPEYIEKIAREEYGMAKKNEEVYRVVPQEKE